MVRDSSLSVRPLFGLSRLVRFYIADPALSSPLFTTFFFFSLSQISTRPNRTSHPQPHRFSLSLERVNSSHSSVSPTLSFFFLFKSSHGTVPYSCLLLHFPPFVFRPTSILSPSVLPSPSLSSFVLRPSPFRFFHSFFTAQARVVLIFGSLLGGVGCDLDGPLAFHVSSSSSSSSREHVHFLRSNHHSTTHNPVVQHRTVLRSLLDHPLTLDDPHDVESGTKDDRRSARCRKERQARFQPSCELYSRIQREAAFEPTEEEIWEGNGGTNLSSGYPTVVSTPSARAMFKRSWCFCIREKQGSSVYTKSRSEAERFDLTQEIRTSALECSANASTLSRTHDAGSLALNGRKEQREAVS